MGVLVVNRRVERQIRSFGEALGASARFLARFRLPRTVAVALVAGAITLPLAVQAGEASGPAVSGPNGKISIEGGQYDSKGSFIGLGSYTIPLGTNYGLQFDGALGTVDNTFLGGGGIHMFYRDPSAYLLGIYGSYHTWNSIDIWRVAVEAELYSGRFSLTSLSGIEGVNNSGSNDHFFGQYSLSYYPTDNFKLSGGFDYLNQTGMGTAGVEYLMHHGLGTPVSLFAKARFGASGYQQFTAGVRVPFGADPSASLIARNRTADPDNYTPVFPRRVHGPQGHAGPGASRCELGSVHKFTSECQCPGDWYEVEGGYQCSTGG